MTQPVDTPAQSGKPTPGSWIRNGLTIYVLHHNGEYRKGVPILVNRFSAHIDPCLYQGGTEAEANANAQLMVTAPDLLAALQELADSQEFRRFPTSTAQSAAISNALIKARAAIAKASPQAR